MTVDVAVLAFFAGAAAYLLWPLPRDPARLVIANEDVYGNAWALAWVARQLFLDPGRLFEANIFHPVPAPLGYTEPLLAQALQAAPVLLLGGSPLLAHNLLVLASFPLAGLGAYLLARDLTGSRGGGILAGLGYAFCSYRFAHLVHVQSLSMQWLPLALLFLQRALRTGRPVHLAGLAGFSLLQALSSGYYAVVLGLGFAVTLGMEARAAHGRRTLGRVAVTLVLAAAVAFAVFIPNRAANRRESEVRGYDVIRSPEEMIRWSAAWGSYLDPGAGSLLPSHRSLHAAFGGAETLFPGLLVIALATVALVRRPRASVVRWAAALVLLGVLFSLGPRIQLAGQEVWGPLELVRGLPPFTSLRTPSRYGVLAILGFDLLAAAGWATLATRTRRALIVPAALALLLDLHPGSRSAGFVADPPPPPTASWLATAPPGVVLELPWDHDTMSMGARYIYWSTFHWQVMVNGWGGVYPKGPFETGVSAKRFPSPDSSRELRRLGVRYVAIHLELLPAARRTRIEDMTELPEGVRLAADWGAHRIYEIDPAGPRERRRAMDAAPPVSGR